MRSSAWGRRSTWMWWPKVWKPANKCRCFARWAATRHRDITSGAQPTPRALKRHSALAGRAAGHVVEMVHRVVQEVAGERLDREAGTVAAVAGAQPLVALNRLERVGQPVTGG